MPAAASEAVRQAEAPLSDKRRELDRLIITLNRLRREVEGRKARHDFSMLHRITGAPPPTAEEQARMPPVWHPMARRHPVSGRKSLFISSIYNDAVEGLDDRAAEEGCLKGLVRNIEQRHAVKYRCGGRGVESRQPRVVGHFEWRL